MGLDLEKHKIKTIKKGLIPNVPLLCEIFKTINDIYGN
jgi:hypothetical protein